MDLTLCTIFNTLRYFMLHYHCIMKISSLIQTLLAYHRGCTPCSYLCWSATKVILFYMRQLKIINLKSSLSSSSINKLIKCESWGKIYDSPIVKFNSEIKTSLISYARGVTHLSTKHQHISRLIACRKVTVSEIRHDPYLSAALNQRLTYLKRLVNKESMKAH
jgi:hypothetical protein